MTKEELEKEAEEYLEKNYCRKTICTCNEIKECKEGIRIRCTALEHRKQLIVDFAEPREKRIEELEKENAISEHDREHNDYELAEVYKKVEQLEKENAELKNRNQELLKSCEGATMMYKDLQKANEIIKKYLAIGVGGKITQNYLDVTKEAEQFISEVEK